MTALRQPDPVDRGAVAFGVFFGALIGWRLGSPAIGVGLAAGNLLLAYAAARLLPGMRGGAGITRFLGLGLPLLLFYVFYKELGLVLNPDEAMFHDRLVAGLEWDWWQRVGRVGGPPWLGELMAASYMAYVPFLLVTLAVLSPRGRDPSGPGETLVRRICIAWAVCYVSFVMLPVLGPRFLLDELQSVRFGHGPFTALAELNQRHGMLHGAAFPSAHIAATFVTAWMAAWWWRSGRLPSLVVALAIAGSTVYLGYHYIIDVVAGVAVGLLATGIDAQTRPWAARRVADPHPGT